MSLESFHHLIKHICMKRKVNKKVGTCVHILLKLQGTKLSIDYLKWKKEKQHTKSLVSTEGQYLKLSTTVILTSSDTQWQVQSSSSIAIYTVSLDDQQYQWSLQSLYCNICIHTYSCTCPDVLINANICKHIHFINVALQQTLITTLPSPLSTTTTKIGSDIVLPVFKTDILTKTNSVHSYYEQQHVSIIATMKQPIKTTQQLFFSTQKSNRQPDVRIVKPDNTNKQHI